MKSFRFPLQRVLEWRGLQLRTEEEKLAVMQHKLSTLIHRENALIAADLKSKLELLNLPAIGGADMQALASFQVRMKKELAALRANRMQWEHQISEQRKVLLKARKEYRVLEKLKEKRFKTWEYLIDREIEADAAEAYIARWAQSQGD